VNHDEQQGITSLRAFAPPYRQCQMGLLSNKQINKQHFPIFGVLLCLCPHPLTQNDQIWHTNTYTVCFTVWRTTTVPQCIQGSHYIMLTYSHTHTHAHIHHDKIISILAPPFYVGSSDNWRAPWKNRIYWYISFFRPSLNRVPFPMFCLLVEGECQILVF